METVTATAYLGLGSNLGDRLAVMSAAVATLNEHPRIKVDFQGGVASLYETSPIGGPPDQPPYLNSALRVQTSLAPLGLLDTVLSIETTLGRVRGERWGPRLIDIDVLLYDDVVLDHERLTLPHPRLHQRRFVLAPLCEIAAEVTHPLLQVTLAQLFEQLGVLSAEDQAVVAADADWYADIIGLLGAPRPSPLSEAGGAAMTDP